MFKKIYDSAKEKIESLNNYHIKRFHLYTVKLYLPFDVIGVNISPKIYSIDEKRFFIYCHYNKFDNIQSISFMALDEATPILIIVGAILGVVGIIASIFLIKEIKETSPLWIATIGIGIYYIGKKL